VPTERSSVSFPGMSFSILPAKKRTVQHTKLREFQQSKETAPMGGFEGVLKRIGYSIR